MPFPWGLALGFGGLALLASRRTGLSSIPSIPSIKISKIVIPPVSLPARLVARETEVTTLLIPMAAEKAIQPLRFVAVPSVFGESKVAEVPIFSEMPPIPAGYRAVNVWGPAFGKKTGRVQPRPDRFRQWEPLKSSKGWEEYGKDWQERYWFGVSRGGALDFYVLGQPSVGLCCESAERHLMLLGGGQQTLRKGAAGNVDGSPWTCTAIAPECFDVIPRRAWTNVPRIDTTWNPQNRG